VFYKCGKKEKNPFFFLNYFYVKYNYPEIGVMRILKDSLFSMESRRPYFLELFFSDSRQGWDS
jgi:hypothetical protein